LAEAIRSQDDNLIRRLEQHGALNTISQENTFEFRAAAYSTAEVGNLPYLKQLLTFVPTANESAFYGPIKKAIETGRDEIATALIIHCAKVAANNAPRYSFNTSRKHTTR
jgi:hypothetical protein